MTNCVLLFVLSVLSAQRVSSFMDLTFFNQNRDIVRMLSPSMYSTMTQYSQVTNAGGYANWYKQQQLNKAKAQMNAQVNAAKQRLLCTWDCADQTNEKGENICSIMNRRGLCNSNTYVKNIQCRRTCRTCTQCTGRRPPTTTKATTTKATTTEATTTKATTTIATTTEAAAVIEREANVTTADNTTAANTTVVEVCTEVPLPCKDKDLRCGRYYYRNCNYRHIKKACPKMCELCETETVCKNVTKTVGEEKEEEEEEEEKEEEIKCDEGCKPDTSSRCASYVEKEPGFCSKWFDMRKAQCKATCKKCKPCPKTTIKKSSWNRWG